MGNRSKKFHLRKKRHTIMQSIARSRITTLFSLAHEVYATNTDLAHSYIGLVRKLAMSTKIRLTPTQRRQICHHCKHLLVPGQNTRYRIHHRTRYGSYLAVTCLDCGHITRYLFKGKACRYKVDIARQQPSLKEKTS